MSDNDDEHEERVRRGLAAMTPERRKELLASCDFQTFRHPHGDYGVMGENGTVMRGLTNEEDAENFILESCLGLFDAD